MARLSRRRGSIKFEKAPKVAPLEPKPQDDDLPDPHERRDPPRDPEPDVEPEPEPEPEPAPVVKKKKKKTKKKGFFG